MKNVKISVKATCKHCQESIDLEEAGMHLQGCMPNISMAIVKEHKENMIPAQMAAQGYMH